MPTRADTSPADPGATIAPLNDTVLRRTRGDQRRVARDHAAQTILLVLKRLWRQRAAVGGTALDARQVQTADAHHRER